jgi:hypothetical protein
MRASRWLGALTIVALTCCGSHGPYAAYSQSHTQGLPGDPSFTLEPPGSVTVSVTPKQAIAVAAPKAPTPNVSVTLARIPSGFTTEPAQESTTPVWVVLVRDSCFASAKGEIVSGSRKEASGNRSPSCTDENLWAAIVSLRSAAIVGGVPGFDVSGSWRPAVG